MDPRIKIEPNDDPLDPKYYPMYQALHAQGSENCKCCGQNCKMEREEVWDVMRQTWVLEQKALQEAFASSYLKAMEAKQEPMPPNASVPALPVQLSPSQADPAKHTPTGNRKRPYREPASLTERRAPARQRNADFKSQHRNMEADKKAELEAMQKAMIEEAAARKFGVAREDHSSAFTGATDTDTSDARNSLPSEA